MWDREQLSLEWVTDAERLVPMEPLGGRLEFWWCWQRKDLTCVVSKQRQFFHLTLCLSSLVNLVTQVNERALNQPNYILLSLSSSPSALGWSLEAFSPHFHSYSVCCNLEKNIRQNKWAFVMLNMNSYITFIWHITSYNFQ